MKLEWDETKRKDALARHGVDFADVVRLDFRNAVTVADNRRNYGEKRFVTYGQVEGRMHVLCWTLRDGAMRVISFRKANDREAKSHSTSA